MNPLLTRRQLLTSSVGGFASAICAGNPLVGSAAAHAASALHPSATEFQIACMTYPYSQFPLQRALSGIQSAGYKFVAWGTAHQESSAAVKTPVLASDASPAKAKELAQRCRDLELEPLMMFSMVYPEADDAIKVLTRRLQQAGAARVAQVLTFGHTEGANQKLWVERFKKLGPIARDQNVTLVVKQHGGETGTGEACAEIIRRVDDSGVRVNYDAGNVMDYLNVDPIPDIQKCADVVHSFCMKDHRNWPVDQDCAPGLGEIDHYRLLEPVASSGRPMPLCCENIFPPLLPRPTHPEHLDAFAKRTRIFLETVVAGLAYHTADKS